MLHISDQEALAFGRLASQRIRQICMGLNATFDVSLEAQAARLDAANEALIAVGEQAATVARATFKDQQDAANEARNALARAVTFLKSRADGEALASTMLGGRNLGEVKALRLSVFVEAMAQATSAFVQLSPNLAGSESYAADLNTHLETLRTRVQAVQQSQLAVRQLAVRTRTARLEWHQAYGIAKQMVKLVLRNADRMDLMPQVFNDLAQPERRVEPRLVG